jgi:uncharacterized protein (DUF2126 family)
MKPEWFAPHFEFKFPAIGHWSPSAVSIVEIRSALWSLGTCSVKKAAAGRHRAFCG